MHVKKTLLEKYSKIIYTNHYQKYKQAVRKKLFTLPDILSQLT